tara:strand:+ start:703 stop:969 length:267 start_codon:yes stop_codon:yes gene_type:complete
MATYYIHGMYCMTQEYAFTTEVEADSPEEASEKFREEAKTKTAWMEIESDIVDKPFDMQGSFTLYETEEDRDDWENAIVEGEGFEGYK